MWHFSWESAPKSFQIPSSSFLSLQQFDYIWLTIFRPWQLIHMVSCVSLYSRRSGQLFLQWPQLSESKRCCPLNLFYLIPCCEDGTDSFQALLHTGVEMRRGSPQFLIMLLGLKFSLFCSVSSRENWGAVPASSPAWVNPRHHCCGAGCRQGPASPGITCVFCSRAGWGWNRWCSRLPFPVWALPSGSQCELHRDSHNLDLPHLEECSQPMWTVSCLWEGVTDTPGLGKWEIPVACPSCTKKPKNSEMGMDPIFLFEFAQITEPTAKIWRMDEGWKSCPYMSHSGC